MWAFGGSYLNGFFAIVAMSFVPEPVERRDDVRPVLYSVTNPQHYRDHEYGNCEKPKEWR